MDFFGVLINEFTALCEAYPCICFPYSEKNPWQEKNYSEVILQRDTFCELDGTGFNLITHKPLDDEIILIGDDIKNISSKKRFARVCIVQLEADEDEQKLYNLIRKVEYVKYHFFPEGYMIRTSSRAHKEAVRISKAAVRRGLTFEAVGNALIRRYKENPAVKGVKVFFITDEKADFSLIESFSQRNNSITEALNHIINSVKFDCDTCSLKPVCDEVEGMKELHFKNLQTGG